MTSNAIAICRWKDVASAAVSAWLRSGVVAVFREAATRWPAEPDAAAAFTELWLDGYLREDADLALVALLPGSSDQPPRVVGYLVASVADPLTDPRFAALGYFRDFAAELPAFPAHLHLNVAAEYRGQRVGENLIENLCAKLAARGCPGVHITTGRSARNVGFYRRCGFETRAHAAWNGRDLVLMGRHLQT